MSRTTDRASRRRGRRGAAMVEMAIMLPLLILFIFGQIEMARLGMAEQLLTAAAREGARTAVIDGSTQADVQARVNAMLSGSGINVGTVTPTPSNWATSPAGTSVTVTLTVPYSTVKWINAPVYLNINNLTASATMSSERP